MSNFCFATIPAPNALLIIFLKIYPRPSFDGKTPSAIKNTDALIWSAITFTVISNSSFLISKTFSIPFIIGINISVSKLLSFFCTTEAILSSPAPVSIFFSGSGTSEPSSSLFHSVNTRFQISKNLSPSSPGLQLISSLFLPIFCVS